MTPEALARIHALAFTESRPWEASEFAALQNSPHCFCLGDSRGFALGRVIAGESELLTIAVCPEFQQQGFGRRLLEAYHAEAQKLGAETCFLEVAVDNKPAICLYESTGYAPAGRRRGYYKRANGSAVDALIFARSLDLDGE